MPNFRNWIVSFAFLIVFFVFPASTFASDYITPPVNKLQTSFIDLMSLASCVIYGAQSSGLPCFGQETPVGQTSGSLLSYGYSATDLFWNTPPLSTTQYISSLTEKFNPVQEASAQVGGSGSSVVSTIFIFWQAARNIAYVVMTLIFIVVGMMILLGRKSGGQSVLTVQAALPGLVISLIMITFSYFFAALITDLAFYGCYLIGYIFVTILGVSSSTPETILGSNNLIQIFLGYIFNMLNFTSVVGFVYSLSDSDLLIKAIIVVLGAFIGGQIVAPLGAIIGGLVPAVSSTAGIGAGIGGLVGGVGTALIPRAPEALVAVLIYIILGIALVVALFKLLKDLVQRYITLLFLTIFAPFIFLVQAMPGTSKGYESWFKNMLCNALAFPAVFAAFYFAAYFLVGESVFMINPASRDITSSVINIPGFGLFPLRSFNTVTTLPFFGGYNLGIINQVIGFGILLATPSIPDYLCKIIGAKSDDVFGKEISGNFSSGRTTVNRYGGRAGSGGRQLGGWADQANKNPSSRFGRATRRVFGGGSSGTEGTP